MMCADERVGNMGCNNMAGMGLSKAMISSRHMTTVAFISGVGLQYIFVSEG